MLPSLKNCRDGSGTAQAEAAWRRLKRWRRMLGKPDAVVPGVYWTKVPSTGLPTPSYLTYSPFPKHRFKEESRMQTKGHIFCPETAMVHPLRAGCHVCAADVLLAPRMATFRSCRPPH
jgi:hypothetical protein